MVAAPLAPQQWSLLGAVFRPSPSSFSQFVLKHGRTTGLTFGSVVGTSFDGVVHYDDGVAYFEDQIVVVGDAVAATAILDRLLHHSHVLMITARATGCGRSGVLGAPVAPPKAAS